MNRRRSRRSFGRARRLSDLVWVRTIQNQQTIGTVSYVDFVLTLPTAAEQLNTTLMRTHIHGAVNNGGVTAFPILGIMVEDAASVPPSPRTSPTADWLWWHALSGPLAPQNSFQVGWIDWDVRARRRLKASTDAIHLTFDNTAAGAVNTVHTLAYSFLIRIP